MVGVNNIYITHRNRVRYVLAHAVDVVLENGGDRDDLCKIEKQ
jgi:hypothetical protein